VPRRGVNFFCGGSAGHAGWSCCLFRDGAAADLTGCSPSMAPPLGDYWHGEVEGLGMACRYRLPGVRSALLCRGTGFNPAQGALDPCAGRSMAGSLRTARPASGTLLNTSLAAERGGDRTDALRFRFRPRPATAGSAALIYEWHVGGFSHGARPAHPGGSARRTCWA